LIGTRPGEKTQLDPELQSLLPPDRAVGSPLAGGPFATPSAWAVGSPLAGGPFATPSARAVGSPLAGGPRSSWPVRKGRPYKSKWIAVGSPLAGGPRSSWPVRKGRPYKSKWIDVGSPLAGGPRSSWPVRKGRPYKSKWIAVGSPPFRRVRQAHRQQAQGPERSRGTGDVVAEPRPAPTARDAAPPRSASSFAGPSAVAEAMADKTEDRS
jgi:hypothetical protein